MAYKLSFRIRRCYFDQIVAGTKDVEVRKRSPFWDCRAHAARDYIVAGYQVVAVFVCGLEVHRRMVKSVLEYDAPCEVLGREPSEQGKQDIGEGPVWGFHLGEVAP